MSTNRLRRRSNFAIVSNAAMRDERLSIEARGLLALMCTYADGWEFRAEHLAAVCDSGTERFQRMMRELRTFGYVSVTPKRGAGGQLCGHQWEILDPAPPERRDLGNPVVGEARTLLEEQEEKNIKREEDQLPLAAQSAPPKPKKRKPETPLPEVFPEDRQKMEAVEHWRGLGLAIDVGVEAVRFRDYHQARDTRFRDWAASWRTWYRTAAQFAKSRSVADPGAFRSGKYGDSAGKSQKWD